MFVIVDFFQNCLCFEFLQDILIPFVVKLCILCSSSKSSFLLLGFWISVAPLVSRCHYHVVGKVLWECSTFVIWFASGLWKLVELD
jgi:hypothetical protein